MNMKQRIEMTGQTFGRWTVTGFSHRCERRRHYWLATCTCGTERAVLGSSLRSGRSQSCGCLTKEVLTAGGTTHGHSRHPAYSSWNAMRERCTNPNATNYEIYGGRGIKVCPRWSAFPAFWLDMGPTWRPDLSLDRIDVNGHYKPGNVRWATSIQQGNNRRNNIVIPTPDGPMTIAQAARRFDVGFATISARIRYGWDGKDLLLPVSKDNSRRQDNVFIPTPSGPMYVVEAANKYGIPRNTIFSRLRYGWPQDELLKPVIKRRSKDGAGRFVPRELQE